MDTVGRYRIVGQLGAGAFATVWRGYDDELDAPVAVKVLAENWAQNADVRRRFVDEARALRRIRDPRVVGVHDIGALPDGRPYFVMDFADAGTLEELVAARVDRAAAVRIGVEVARAAQVLHDHGVLHRDLKPSNVLRHRRPDGTERLMIADLGTAKAIAGSSGLTMAAGTPAYMAPEQAHGQRALDVRADVYGVAALTYALVAGRPPFPGDRGAADVAFRSPAVRPDLLSPGGSDLDDVLGAALAFDPAQRPSTAAQLAERLARCDATRQGEPARAGLGAVRLAGLALVVAVVAAVLTWLVLGLLG